MPKLYFMYAAESSTTGKAILDALKDAGVNVKGGKEPDGRDSYDALIRWGSTRQVAVKPKRVLNQLRAISSASDKLAALVTLKQNRIHVPEILQPNEVTPGKFPLLGRKRHHTHGKDIVLCLQMNDIQRALNEGCTYFTRYIPTKAEYRVHVFKGEPIKISQKLLTEPDLATEPWVRNLDAGYTFHNQHLRLSARDSGSAVDAVSVLGLDFGAVDLIVGDDGEAYILEVNTAPGLIESGIDVYVDKFKAFLQAA